MQWINSRREYPTKKGCTIMALTVEVIRMLDDAYEDNSDDDLGIDIVEQENAFFSGEGNSTIEKINNCNIYIIMI